MDTVIGLSPRERAELFDQTAQLTGMAAMIVEKDFWVCWTLKQMFGLPEIGEHLIFKGGTSLSKAFKLIERFSEDIDVSVDRSFLGFGGDNEPESAPSSKRQQERISRLKAACQQFVTTRLRPVLEDALSGELPKSQSWSLTLDEEDKDGQTLLFEYPSSYEPGAHGYIRRMVKIEMGARADHWPFESKEITPYVAEEFPDGFKERGTVVKVLSAERTFWEKATILHAEHHRPIEKPMPERFSRHYYDLFEMVRRGVAASAAAKPGLLARVAEHKSLYFRSGWAKYDEAKKGSLRLSVREGRIAALRSDYQKMQQMFFKAPPSLEEILEELSEWEKSFNGTS
jgi:hypothetical protein